MQKQNVPLSSTGERTETEFKGILPQPWAGKEGGLGGMTVQEQQSVASRPFQGGLLGKSP